MAAARENPAGRRPGMAPKWATIPMLALLSSRVIPPRSSSPGFKEGIWVRSRGGGHGKFLFRRENPRPPATPATALKLHGVSQTRPATQRRPKPLPRGP